MKITVEIVYDLWVRIVATGLFLAFIGCSDEDGPNYVLEDCNFAMDINQSVEVDTPIGYAIFTDSYTEIPGCYGVYTDECSGADCDQLFSSHEDCQDSMNSCIEDVLDSNCAAACDVQFNCYTQGEGEDGQSDGEHEGGISQYYYECIYACTNIEDQEIPFLCAQSAECYASATCDNVWEQNCPWNYDCFYETDYQ
mgnify:CR=1 FL=1